MLSSGRPAAKAQAVVDPAGFQSSADGPAKVQLAGAARFPLPGGQLPVDPLGHRLNGSDGPGDLIVLKGADVPVQNAQLRVKPLAALPRVLHEHLLLHDGPGKDRMDKFTVQCRVPLGVSPVPVHEAAQPLPGFLAHEGIGFLLGFGKGHLA